jgi:hypothetical protein
MEHIDNCTCDEILAGNKLNHKFTLIVFMTIVMAGLVAMFGNPLGFGG